MNIIKSLLTAAIMCATGVVQADWSLNSDASSINAVSVKKTAVAEVHKFKKLSGAIDDQGQLSINIDLASIESMIPIRNERLRNMLFEIQKFPAATVTGQLNMSKVAQLQIGGRLLLDTPFNLSLHGHMKTANAKVTVQKLANGSLQIFTQEPIILKALDFDLLTGIQNLQKVAKLSAIATAIPISGQLIFERS